jgi:hypothetical protein
MILDHCRDKKELYDLYIKYPMNDGIFDFDFISNNPHLYCFYDEKEGFLKGYINIYEDEENRLLLSGASIRHNLPENIKAIIKVCEAYNQDMYADTDKKEAEFCLRKAGFKKFKGNLFKRCKNG